MFSCPHHPYLTATRCQYLQVLQSQLFKGMPQVHHQLSWQGNHFGCYCGTCDRSIAMSLAPVIIMGGFKKCGIYPINPSEVSDRQLAPSKAFQPQKPSQFGPESEKTKQLESSSDSPVLEMNSSHQKRCCTNLDMMKAMTWLTLVT